MQWRKEEWECAGTSDLKNGDVSAFFFLLPARASVRENVISARETPVFPLFFPYIPAPPPPTPVRLSRDGWMDAPTSPACLLHPCMSLCPVVNSETHAHVCTIPCPIAHTHAYICVSPSSKKTWSE